MMQNNAPQFPRIFGYDADSGTITTIGDAPSHGRASLAKAFPIETMTPLAAGGVPPNGADMNGILSMLSVSAQEAAAGLVREYSSTYSGEIGGYPQGALVRVGSHLYSSQQENNTNAPPSDGSDGNGWKNILSDAFQTVTGAYLPLSGGKLTGALVMDGGASGTWAGTVPVALAFNDGKQGMVFGQVNADGSYQTLINASNDGGRTSKSIALRADTGQVVMQDGANLLQVLTSNGRLSVTNLPNVASGQILANLEDVQNETNRATNAEQAETNRATAAENDKVSGTNGMGENDKRGLGLYYRPVGVGGFPTATFKYDGGYIDIAGYPWVLQQLQNETARATNAEQAETNRAIAAENDKVSGTNGMGENDKRGLGLYYRPVGVGGFPTATFKYDGGYIDIAGYPWVMQQLAGYLPLSGGTLTGDLTMNGANSDNPWAASVHMNFPYGAPNVTGQIYHQLDGDKNPSLVMSVPKRDGQAMFFVMRSDGGLALPGNCTALEFSSNDRTLAQTFYKEQVTDSDRVNFPVGYADADVAIYLDVDGNNIKDKGSASWQGYRQAAGAKAINRDANGFSLSLRFTDNDGDNYPYTANIRILAIGKALPVTG